MSRPLTLVLLASAASLAGCVGSLYPLWKGPDMIADARIVGTWHEPGSTGWVDVAATGPFTYRILVRDDSGRMGAFGGLLGRLDGRLVLDVQPDVTRLPVPATYSGMLQPLHAFVFIDSLGEHPRFSILEPDSLRKYLIAHPGAVRADTLTAGVVLEAGPADLQAFLRAYVRRPGVVGAPETMSRCTDCRVPGR
ncbi:MAG TPA: hypothetical protein VEH62_09410 [Gemmatimonadales bacterium]|nr:hypothetical protein [Gemmatimonadales bacterium]